MGLIDRLGAGPVAIDTVCFIYFIEERSPFVDVLAPLFESVAGGMRRAVTSALTLLEVLVVPYRARDVDLAARYEALLTRSAGLRLIDVDRQQLRAAAQLRAGYSGLRTPDALQLAAAVAARCSSLVTNDRRYPPLAGLDVVQLSDVA